jgi:hypothetical protein
MYPAEMSQGHTTAAVFLPSRIVDFWTAPSTVIRLRDEPGASYNDSCRGRQQHRELMIPLIYRAARPDKACILPHNAPQPCQW